VLRVFGVVLLTSAEHLELMTVFDSCDSGLPRKQCVNTSLPLWPA
jgi:hypothetical protein